MGYHVSSLEELGDGYGFRKIRQALGVTAFGVNALVFPPQYEGPEHCHDTQDELYFVHRGTATFTIDGNEHEVGEGGLGHVEATPPRREPHRRGRRVVHRRRQGRLRRARRPADGPRRAGEAAGSVTQGGADVNGLMMDFQLTLPMLLRRAETYNGQKEIVTRLPDR